MSELLDKQVNAQKEKTSRVHAGSRKPTKKVYDENERNKQTRKKRHVRKNYIHGRTGGNDLHERRGDDYGYNKGTICLLSGLIGVKWMVFRVWVHKRVPLNSQWLVLGIGGADFLHCWVAGSICLERTESLITKR